MAKRITYDCTADAAYIYLAPVIKPGAVHATYPCDPADTGGEVNLDFDVGGRLIGIEVLDASRKLHPALLKEAEIIAPVAAAKEKLG